MNSFVLFVSIIGKKNYSGEEIQFSRQKLVFSSFILFNPSWSPHLHYIFIQQEKENEIVHEECCLLMLLYQKKENCFFFDILEHKQTAIEHMIDTASWKQQQQLKAA